MNTAWKIFGTITLAAMITFAACDLLLPLEDDTGGTSSTGGASAHTHQWGAWAPTANTAEEEQKCACGDKQIRLTGTTRFTFTSIGGGAYSVQKGTVTSGEVLIPAYYRPNASSQYLPVTTIGEEAFYFTDLTSVVIPSTVTTIGESAFRHTRLTNVTIPNSVTALSNFAFWGCNMLTSITIPNSVTTIGIAAFDSCTKLTSITIPGSVTTIGRVAFQSCSALTSVTIPSSVTTLGDNAFSRCPALTNITVAAANPNYASQGGILYNKTKTTLIAFPSAKGSVTIPNGVTNIEEAAFRECTALTSVIIPNSVTNIGDGAFSICSELASVTIGSGVKTIGDGAFLACEKLKSVTIPAGITSIGYMAFYQCVVLESVTVQAATPPDLGTSSTTFGLNHPNRRFYVPAARVTAYKAAPSWSAFASAIYAIP